ncbi:hypothetical protein CBA19CS11_06455 [Caballeronia novacaledonica]|nr:hypothetical protein CBA19CS11_06455 [Caballeronia novacaledonica]
MIGQTFPACSPALLNENEPIKLPEDPGLVGYLAKTSGLGAAIGMFADGAYLVVLIAAFLLPETKGRGIFLIGVDIVAGVIPQISSVSSFVVRVGMNILVSVKRVIDYSVKARVKPGGTGVDMANVKMR